MVPDRQVSSIPRSTETVIIGNGPSALFLSFLLHGNVPRYIGTTDRPHPDTLLHNKLFKTCHSPLYHTIKDVNYLTEHFEASGRYSDDAWPINTLLDTLLWPDSASDWDADSFITFERNSKLAQEHIVLGSAQQSGGQWSENIGITKGENAKTLSYSEQLSLPGYSFAEFYADEYGQQFGFFERPRRPDVSAYYAKYPLKVHISDTFRNGTLVDSVERHAGKYIVSGIDDMNLTFSITCKNLVLACGLFTHLIEPPIHLSPYIREDSRPARARSPILIIGSGFSAADAVIENLGVRDVIHLYKWETAPYTSPLKHCHRSSYPEYADIYQRMKMSTQRSDYCGFADAHVVSVEERGELFAVVVKDSTGQAHTVTVGEIAVLAGRRTSLDFLSADILHNLNASQGWLEKHGLRDQIVPQGAALTVDRDRILCIGSITGDSLIKFMFGAAIGAAGHLLGI